MIGAEEARRIADGINKASDEYQIKLIEERITDACRDGEYELIIYFDDDDVPGAYLRDNTEKLLLELGYKIRMEPACTFGQESYLVISWEDEEEL